MCMKILQEHRQIIGIAIFISLIITLEIILYINYDIKLDSYSGCIASIAAILGVVLSVNSITNWGNKQKAIQENITIKNKEIISDKKIKLAGDIMTACYQLEQSILKISNPFTYLEEIQKAQEMMKSRKGITNRNRKRIERGLVFKNRLENELSTINKFFALKIQAKIYFGESLSDLFDKISQNIKEKIYINIIKLLQVENYNNEEESASMQIWNLSIQDNFMKKIIPEIEKILLPLLRDKN